MHRLKPGGSLVQLLHRIESWDTFKEIPLVRSSLYESDEAVVQDMRDSFGPQFLRLAEPIWEIQAEALRNAPFLRHASHTNVK
ncbi:uncharacterized protein N7506_005606 [Penicillium brevicompactum]|uniref:uncharacterized protein n=1 Tax=Penicillium brevicompactum TaxID=5074 RepID=UPI0025419EA5|nr:uncharacterized protein N7506_005606 [Penicillium brevicompactum]KAJ5335670.1 hypothetical protein N7506_005606 [Penicillium brevicompactum]